jgi:GTP-binding protein
MSFTVAIIGRPNVGKSTLYNRLTGKRHALVDDTPGVTRDRREGDASLGGLSFRIIDTAGLEDAKEGTLQARMTAQSQEALRNADVTLMVIDGRAGLTPADEHFARLVRKSGRPSILVVNKAEGNIARSAIAEAHRLGLGEPVAISAEHGEGLADLYDALAPFDKDETAARDDEDGENADETVPVEDIPLHIAVIGRPNAGKSTLINHILGKERLLTGPEAGITRDSIAVEAEFEGKKLKIVDTAGMRRKANVVTRLEKLAVADSLHSIQYAQVVILVIDAQQPLEKQDNTIAALVEQEGRAMVLAVNKWDAVTDKPAYLKAIEQRLEMVMPQMKGVPVVPISGLTGWNVPKLLKECYRVYGLWNRQFGTGALNRWLEDAITEHTPPMVKGRRIKIRYMTQKSTRPPTFLLFSNTGDIPESYLRYLVNSMRETFRLPGVPIRIKIRKNKNPYSEPSE